jgi:hypothetical protein
MAFLDAFFPKTLQTPRDEFAAQSAPPVIGMNRKMAQVASSPVVSGKQRSCNVAILLRNEAQSRISVKEDCDILPGVGVTQVDSWARLP